MIGHQTLLHGEGVNDLSDNANTRALSPPLGIHTATNDSAGDQLSSIEVSPMVVAKNLLPLPADEPGTV